MKALTLILGALCLCITAAAPAQTLASPDENETSELPRQQPMRPSETDALPGRTAESAAGRVGQRQTREEAVEGIEPMTRISNRINNRVQSRIRNRIDPNYDPQANATSPFAVAEEETRAAQRR